MSVSQSAPKKGHVLLGILITLFVAGLAAYTAYYSFNKVYDLNQIKQSLKKKEEQTKKQIDNLENNQTPDGGIIIPLRPITPEEVGSYKKTSQKKVKKVTVSDLIRHPRKTDCDRMRRSGILCLACNIYHEARNQSAKSQIAVANVTLNRVHDNRFPDTICKVVWQHHQFSWTWDGKPDQTYEIDAWRKALRLSVHVLKEKHRIDNTGGALWYHASYVDPRWSKEDGMRETAALGQHIFYKR